ncbi:MAG: hypothetical protein AcusKO_23190 [Acuticoccus sp.]
MRLLLRHGARGPAGTNALARALDFNDHETVRLLLVAGADPDEGAGGGADGLIAALPQAARRMCDGAMIRLLLDHGASPGARWQGRSAYALARIYGNAAAAALLAEAGADTNAHRPAAAACRRRRRHARRGCLARPRNARRRGSATCRAPSSTFPASCPMCAA